MIAPLIVFSQSSIRYGTTPAARIPALAVAAGYTHCALTDRNGLYGAIEFAQAAIDVGITPILGVSLPGIIPGVQGQDIAKVRRFREADSGVRQPVKGGTCRRDYPQIIVLARGQEAGLAAGAGWSALCQLVSHMHETEGFSAALRGQGGAKSGGAGVPGSSAVADFLCTDDLQPHNRMRLLHPGIFADNPDGANNLQVLLSGDSDVGRAVAAGKLNYARRLLQAWRAHCPHLAVALGAHTRAPRAAGGLLHNLRLWRLAHEEGVPAVIAPPVRHPEAHNASLGGILDALRARVLYQPAVSPVGVSSRLGSAVTSSPIMNAQQTDTVSARGSRLPNSSCPQTGLLGEPGLPTMTQLAAQAQALAREESAGRAPELLAATTKITAECGLDGRTDLGLGQLHTPEEAILGINPGRTEAVLRQRVQAGISRRYPHLRASQEQLLQQRLRQELQVLSGQGYSRYVLTVAQACTEIERLGVRYAARGSAVGSLVHYLLGISRVDPLQHGLLMERFCSEFRPDLPDIDIDVESARRYEVIDAIFSRFGAERVMAVSMVDTYRARSALREVGAVLGFAASEIQVIAKAFPRIRARNLRAAWTDLPELRALTGLRGNAMMETLLDTAIALDGFPRHVSVHPCGLILSDSTLRQRVPWQQSAQGLPMSQFDKSGVETMGLLKLDVLGVRMQSALAHAQAEMKRVGQPLGDIDDPRVVPPNDPDTFALIRRRDTVGCFQIESPGQRDLAARLMPQDFGDLIMEISLFRPGPVQANMIDPLLRVRHGQAQPHIPHPSLAGILQETYGVVVFQEQVLQILAVTTGISLGEAEKVRRKLTDAQSLDAVEQWWRKQAHRHGFDQQAQKEIWQILASFAAFGFCKAHAAAFAVPTLQSAWLKCHYPAAFYAGLLTHAPGMYPKRGVIADARDHGVPILPVEVNASQWETRVEQVLAPTSEFGVRLGWAHVHGLSHEQVIAIMAGQPYESWEDFWQRMMLPQKVMARLVQIGVFDQVEGPRVSRRELLLRVHERKTRRKTRRKASSGQLFLPLLSGNAADSTQSPGLPVMEPAEVVEQEMQTLGMDVSAHVLDVYKPLLAAIPVTWAVDLPTVRLGEEFLVAGVKTSVQTPPLRSGKRVIFLTLDDGTGLIDTSFFAAAQEQHAHAILQGSLLLIRAQKKARKVVGFALQGLAVWSLPELWKVWQKQGLAGVQAVLRPEATKLHPETVNLSVDSHTVSGGSSFGSSGPAVLEDSFAQKRSYHENAQHRERVSVVWKEVQ